MSIKQSRNKIQNHFVNRENNHNILSFIFFIFVLILSITFIIISAIIGSIYVLIPSIILTIFSIIKILLQVKYLIGFKKLLSTIDNDNIGFYITKSWNRKREATIWFSIMAILLMLIPLIITLSLQTKHWKYDVSTLFISILFIVIIGYLNIQTLEGNLKLSERKMNMNSMEWKQIKKEARIFYRLMFIYFLSILLIIPLLFLIIPAYREWIYRIVKN